MKKLLLTSLAAAALSLASLSASAAGTANSTFDVTVNLTPKCQTTTTTKPVMTFNYVAFGPAVTSNQISLEFKCTKGVVISNAAITALAAPGDVLLGLAYTLTLGTATTGTLAGAGPTAAATYAYTIDGGMIAAQAGDITGGSPATHSNRELVITY